MAATLTNEIITSRFGSFSLITGILLIILGTAGFFLPGLMSLGTVIFVAWMLIVGAAIWAVHTYKYNTRSVMNWIKPALLLITGGLMLFYPLPGIATVGLLLAVYLLLDAFGSFVIAQSIHPASGWGWMLFNGITSLVLAMLFLYGWPATSLWLVGLYVSISLLFDGIALLAVGLTVHKAGKL
ncbi:hypothetical protein MNBD_GAMMA13-18 [hydrothermal vent metagenome]|uniref:Acid-resistance membrane protein n=1 Tax=hydrothermal vent metagenome TaxID=652676 RepID=A0A3B0YLH3_9ZZZZ